MRSTSRLATVTSLLASGCFLILPVLCLAEEWVELDDNQGSTFFYDKSGTSKPKAGIFRVKTRVIYTEEGKNEALKTLASPKGMEKLYESRYVYDLDCSEQETRLLEVTHLDKKGTILKSSDLSRYTDWEALPPEARMAIVAAILCPES